MIIRKEFSPATEMMKPTAADLEIINRHFALEPVGEDDIRVVTMRVANDQVDRSFERFTPAVLQRFADTLPGKPVLTGHDTSKSPRGRFFAGSVSREMDGTHHLVGRAYLEIEDPLVKQVRFGIAKDVSVGAAVDQRQCDLCADGKDYDREGCDHWAGRTYDGKVATLTYGGDLNKYEVHETSFVYLGCQRGAQAIAASVTAPVGFVVKSLVPGGSLIVDYGTSTLTVPKENDMDLKEALAEIERLKGELAKAGDAALAADGKAYREHLKAEITRMAGKMEKSGTYAQVLKHMEKADAAGLKEIVDELAGEVEKKFPPSPHGRPADPPPPGGNDGGERKVFNPWKRAPLPAEKAA